MSSNAFAPQGNTVFIAAAAASSGASAGVRVNGSVANATQRLVQNIGTKTAYLAGSLDSTIAAVAPTAGTPANGVPVQAGAILVLSYPPNTYFSAICASTDTTTLMLTPGEGN